MDYRSEEGKPENGDEGIWIGIDLGTSNSACAVWDSSRGGSKWVRLPGVTEFQGTKAGRIMPSVVRFRSDKEDPVVGFPALLASQEGSNNKNRSSILRSVKRLLGKRYGELDWAWTKTLDFDVKNPSEHEENDNNDGSLRLIVRTNSTTDSIEVTPEQVLAIELSAIRKACQAYLDRYRRSKNLSVPGGGDETEFAIINNVVVGVPAHFSQRHIGLVKEACRKAGFRGYVGTCLESTAAAIAYGLTLQERSRNSIESYTEKGNKKRKKGGQTIMVIDMGGGTTDITVVERITNRKDLQSQSSDSLDHSDPSSSYRVLVTQGDDRLGGDDIDQAIMEYCLSEVSRQDQNDQRSKINIKALKLACRKAKESLCQLEDPIPSEAILVNYCDDDDNDVGSREILVTKENLNVTILEPWLARARNLIVRTHDALNENGATKEVTIDEVVLVGGTTRVPAIRHMIESIFPEIELSSSLNPMSSVAQGLAIQAAIKSKRIPMHELKSAMMLDCVPHAIGVQLTSDDGTHSGGFVEIIPRNTLLPAMGSAMFVLANKNQAGVTVRAVEKVGLNKFERMNKEDFSFFLRRLTKSQLENASERTIQVGMKLETDGRFIVSIFDENDPEHVLKRDRFERVKNGEVVGELDYIKNMIQAESDEFTREQVSLAIALVSLFVLYVAIKMAFTDTLENGSSILE